MTTVRSAGRVVAVLALAATLGACHSYREVTPGDLRPGTAVRVEIERQEAVRQVERLGDLETSISGTIQELTADALGLTIRDPNATPGQNAFRRYVEFPRDRVVRIEEKRFDPVKTGLFAAAGGVVTWLVLQVTEGSSQEGPETPGPNSMTIGLPIFRLGG